MSPNRTAGRPAACCAESHAGSGWIHGNGTRACTRRWISTSATCRSTAEDRSGCACFSCLSSTISRGSARGARGGRSDTWTIVQSSLIVVPARVRSTRSVLIIGSEALPFAKTGGLADVLGALPPALARLGWDATVVLPRYRHVEAAKKPVVAFPLAIGGQRHGLTLYEVPIDGARAILVDVPELFD